MRWIKNKRNANIRHKADLQEAFFGPFLYQYHNGDELTDRWMDRWTDQHILIDFINLVDLNFFLRGVLTL